MTKPEFITWLRGVVEEELRRPVEPPEGSDLQDVISYRHGRADLVRRLQFMLAQVREDDAQDDAPNKSLDLTT